MAQNYIPNLSTRDPESIREQAFKYLKKYPNCWGKGKRKCDFCIKDEVGCSTRNDT